MASILAALFGAFISLPGAAPIVNGIVPGVVQQLTITIGLEGSVG